MGVVARLADAVINQIAAGEVVERPASVVKELVENALDAEATRIFVEIEGGGLERISVADDGIGMSREDALLAIERHATSKLRGVEDLDRLATLGFRGEAVPSIASVSRFLMTTTERGKLAGTEIEIEGGRLVRSDAVGAPPGTTISVKDLFYNVPARRKFLKRPETETSHVGEILTRLALTRPGVAFRLTQGGRTVLDAPRGSSSDPLARIGRILGREISEHLFAVVEAERGPAVHVRGFIGAPSLSERTARGLYVYVNGRPVRDRTIQHAIVEGYKALIERGRYPVVLLFLEVDPSAVDVNVHPQKTEVRFASTSDVHRAITGAITRTLLGQPWLASAGREEARPSAAAILAEARVEAALRPPPMEPLVLIPSPTAKSFEPFMPRWDGGSIARDAPPPAELKVEPTPPLPRPAPALEERAPPPPRPPRPPRPSGRFGRLRPIGVLLGRYLVCESPERLVLLDPSLAEDALVRARLAAELERGRLEPRPLMMPLILELSGARRRAAEERGSLLSALGLELDPFGPGTFALKAVPGALEAEDTEAMLLEILDAITEDAEIDAAALLPRMAKHAAAPPLPSTEEAPGLLAAIDALELDDRAAEQLFVEWSERELARLFEQRR